MCVCVCVCAQIYLQSLFDNLFFSSKPISLYIFPAFFFLLSSLNNFFFLTNQRLLLSVCLWPCRNRSELPVTWHSSYENKKSHNQAVAFSSQKTIDKRNDLINILREERDVKGTSLDQETLRRSRK